MSLLMIMSLFGEVGTVKHSDGDIHVVILLRKWVIASDKKVNKKPWQGSSK